MADPSDRNELRKALREGDVDAADRAMSLLLGRPDVDAADFAGVLDAIERLGMPARSRMFETFLLHVGESAPIAVPVLVRYIEQSPSTWSAGLAAAALGEVLADVPGGRDVLDRRAVVGALVHAVAASARSGTDSAAEAVRTLHAWSRREPIPEAGPALRDWLLRAASEPRPNEYFLRLAVETLAASGQASLLDEVRRRASALPPDHPLARALRA